MPRQHNLIAVLIATAFVAGLQVAPWLLTPAPVGCGPWRTGGFPLAAVKHGIGINGFEDYLFESKAFVVNGVISVVIFRIAYLWGDQLLLLGPRRFWTKLRRWGTSLDEP